MATSKFWRRVNKRDNEIPEICIFKQNYKTNMDKIRWVNVFRYILYKELMTKDQNLETCRAQVKRLQGELKMMSRENCLLHEKRDKNNPQVICVSSLNSRTQTERTAFVVKVYLKTLFSTEFSSKRSSSFKSTLS